MTGGLAAFVSLARLEMPESVGARGHAVGDREFEKVFWAMQSQLLRFASFQLDASAAEDAVAETFSTLWRKDLAFPATDRAEQELRSLAYAVLAGHIRNEYRSRRRRQSLRVRYVQSRQHDEVVPDPALALVANDEMMSWMVLLSAEEREVLLLFNAGFDVAETARILDVSEAAVAKRRTRAKKRLRTLLSSEDGESR